MLTRSEVLKILSTLPLTGLFASQLARGETPSVFEKVNRNDENIFRSLGVEPIINCRGTFTIIGGSIEHPHVKESMQRASNNFIQYDELAFGIGQRLAELTGAEWGMISSGCAAALKHVTAGCVAGGNPEKLIRIPDLRGLDKTQVIMPRRSRTSYDHAVRNIGVEIVMADTMEDVKRLMNDKTALILVMSGQSNEMRDAGVPQAAREWGIPIMVDAAAEDLTIPNVHLQNGADVVAYSGGKAFCGPQCSGVILGRKDILMAAWQASSPHHGPGRDNKVGREEMIGGMAAVEAWIMRNHGEEWQRWLGWLNNIGNRVGRIRGVNTEIQEPQGLSNRTPRLRIEWDPEQLHVTGEEVAEELGRTRPRIALAGGTSNGVSYLSITSGQMQPGEDEIVKERIHEVLSRRRRAKPAMNRPAGEITGRWNVDVKFYHSESSHTITIEKQDGNWVWGSHKGDFSTRDLAGTIEGNEVKLVSVDRIPGDTVRYIFIGELDGESISGRVFMGEYLEASFTAQRHAYPTQGQPVMVPDGPPLAT